MEARRHLVGSSLASLLETLRPALMLRRDEDATSHLGGSPTSQRVGGWPTTSYGRGLSLLAEFTLSREHANLLGLPGPGVLAFYFDSVEAPWSTTGDALRVEYVEGARTYAIVPPNDCDQFDEVRVGLVETEIPRLGVPTTDTLSAYRALQEKLDPRDAPLAFLGGHAFPLQTPMEDECASIIPAVPASEWRLLLQLDTDRRAGFAWGSGSGRLYFWIPEEDLARARFERVVAITQDT